MRFSSSSIVVNGGRSIGGSVHGSGAVTLSFKTNSREIFNKSIAEV